MVLHSACIFELVGYFLALPGGCVDYVVVFGVDVFFRAAFLLVGARCNLLLHFDNHFRCVWSRGLIFLEHIGNPQGLSDPWVRGELFGEFGNLRYDG